MIALLALNTIVLGLAAQAAPIAESNAGLFNLNGLSTNIVNSVEQLELNLKLDSLELTSNTDFPPIFNENPELFKLHADLVNIESISHNEFGVSRYLQSYLHNLGLGLTLEVDSSNRNIYAYGGKNENSSVLLTSHIDTVPPYINYYIKENKNDGSIEIHGRGSCDAKGSVAAQIIAAKELLQDNLVTIDELSFLFVFQEEVGGAGMKTANDYFNKNQITWDTVIFGEPTENKLAIGHKGIFMADVEVIGLASHSGYPEVGIDANKILIEIMHELETYPWPTSESLNETTLNIGLIDAGTASNVISPDAKCSVLLRTAVDANEIASIVEKIIKKYESLAKEINYSIGVTDDPVSLDYQVEGFETYVASYATDIPKLDHKNFKRYLYGPGSILVAHGDNEYVTAASLLKAVEDYKKLILFSLRK
jgi:acetylornithine deacetylase/succinyl-diaminopimelate desuccinylase-like protein